MVDDATSPPVEHWSNPALSIFQSAVAAADVRRSATTASNFNPGTPPPVDHGTPFLLATARAARTLLQTAPAAGSAALRSGLTRTIMEDCAHAYVARALAEASGDPTRIEAAQRALPPFGTCDGRWIEALNEFLLHYALRRHSDVPYRRWDDLRDFVIPDPRDPSSPSLLTADSKIAFISDWGTGEPLAQQLLTAVAAFRPDVVIHLGDIYYSCDLREANSFYVNVRSVFPAGSARVFTLCGNHDMYSGGTPYYALLDRLGQPASFFCLRNDSWQILAMDTGYNDYDPFEEQRSAPWVQDGTDAGGRPAADDYSELSWHADKVAGAGSRKTVLLSHHPPFTLHSPIAGDQARNERLLRQVRPWIDQVTLWLWGHEHSQVIYEPFERVRRGRCLGAGAIPTLPSEDPYAVSAAFAPGQTLPTLRNDPFGRLRVDPGTGYYELGFGILSLAGDVGTMTYYGFDKAAGPRVVDQEQL